MTFKTWLLQVEAKLDARAERIHLLRFEKLKARLAARGSNDPAKHRSRLDAVAGSLHSFPYMLWTVRRQLWKETAFRIELAALVLGSAIGWWRGFGPMQWAVLVIFGIGALLAEANNTATEMKCRSFQARYFGGTQLDIDIGDIFEFAALPVAFCAWPWGLMWVAFMFFPGY